MNGGSETNEEQSDIKIVSTGMTAMPSQDKLIQLHN